jgi:hypothetical protein
MERGRAVAAQLAHNQQAEGSIPSPAKRYQKVGKSMIRPLILNGESPAFLLAEAHYIRHGKSFMRVLLDFLINGFVVSRPHLFAMGKPIERDGKRGWFIEYAVGNMLELLTCLPCKLDFIAFCRDEDDNMRVIDFDVFFDRATRKVRMEQNGRRIK